MLKKLLSLLVLSVIATSAWAQTSQSASRSLSLTIVPFLTVTGTRDISFGTARRIDGPLFSSATNYAEWTVDTDPGNSVSISFTLPTQMINGAATSFPVALTYGAASAYIDQNASQFSPATGLGNDIVPNGHAVLRLGFPQHGTGTDELVKADISNAKSGSYTAVVTATVSVNP